MRSHVPVRLAITSTLLLGGLAALPARAGSSPALLVIHVVSNRADLVSGGDAVVQVDLPSGAARATVTVDGRNVSRAFAVRPNHRFRGLLTGLRVGGNTVIARAGGQTARLTITNHDAEGPVFSGPQLQPWYCSPGALDKRCRRHVTYAFQYMSSVTGQFAVYDPKSPPVDVATTTTDQGRTVPYVVRIESGTIDRSAYSIGVLYDGSKPFTRWTGPPAWNHKLFITHGGGCGGMHTEGAAPSVLDNSISRGFVVMSTALDDSNQDCNVVVQAESIMMAKERVTDAYGDIRYTIGMGSSGGSLASLQMANAYPGLYDGLLVGATFPDAMLTDLLDCVSLSRYFNDPTKWGAGVVWPEPSQAAVADKQSIGPCALEALPFGPEDYSNMYNPSDPAWCGMSSNQPERVYNATTNPTGVRCAIQDYFVNVLGTRPPARWGAVEKKIKRGFANRPYDTVGVMFGLKALQAGTITKEQFVDLNTKLGAVDIDFGTQPTRVSADPAALTAVYRSGMVDEANNLDRIPIIDIPNTADDYDIHDKFKSWSLRARLDAANGHHDNHILWYGPGQKGLATNAGDGNAFQLIDGWLTGIESDHRSLPIEQKVVRDKPADAKDRCDLPDQSTCNAAFHPAGSVRNGAGEGIANDVMKCQLRPLNRSDFVPVLFSDDQWAALRKTFPTGVCDWSKPGAAQRRTIAWQTYTAGPGGQPLGTPPRSELLDAR
jgi:hypothetical protein